MATRIDHNEYDLIQHVAQGDEDAFRKLFELYSKLLFPFLYRSVNSAEVAEELIQEVMLKVWLNRDKLSELDYPRQWIFRIAANLAYNGIKRRLHERNIKVELAHTSTEDADLNHELTLNELKQHIAKAIDQMPTERRRIYLLSREGGLSRDEIAAQLGISPKTVKNTISQALQSIREYLAQIGYNLPMFLLLMIV